LFPGSGIEIAKDFDPIGRPTPPVIPSQRLEGLQRRRQISLARFSGQLNFFFGLSSHSSTFQKKQNPGLSA
jgi:hypothetical protein